MEKFKEIQQQYIPFLTEVLMVVGFLVSMTLVLSASTLFRLEEFSHKRCFTSTSLEMIPPIFDDLGASFGILDFRDSKLSFVIYYTIPNTELGIKRITIRGPLKIFGIGVPLTSGDIAITLCGGDISCSDMEAASCIDHGYGQNCGIVSHEILDFDQTTPDVEVCNECDFGETLHALQSTPQHYYLQIETYNHVNGAQRGTLDKICPL